MMDRDIVVNLLTIAQANDHRTFGVVDIELWCRVLGNITETEAVDAILAHLKERPGVWLEPGHVVERVKAARRDAYQRMDPDERPYAQLGGGPVIPPGVPRDRFGLVDKSAPDDEDYPADWTPDQRKAAYWAKINRLRDEYEREQAASRFGSLLKAPPATAVQRHQAIESFLNSQRAFDDPDDDEIPYVNVLTVPCGFCKSAVGEQCTVWGLPGRPREKLKKIPGHPMRIRAAAIEAGFDAARAELIVDAMMARQARRARNGWTPADIPKPPPERRSDGAAEPPKGDDTTEPPRGDYAPDATAGKGIQA